MFFWDSCLSSLTYIVFINSEKPHNILEDAMDRASGDQKAGKLYWGMNYDCRQIMELWVKWVS